MAIFKCKMCGGMVECESGATVGVCDSCGTKQTLPRLDDEKRVALYERANHFRRSGDFDKAAAVYEQILTEDGTDAEAYWSLVLCCYGIEYVEDPITHRRVPTVNRSQYTSVYADENYKAALRYADSMQKELYTQEAGEIDGIQKGILEISSQEKPFDVFICYKENDQRGRRTPDSVLGTELYHELTKLGYKVFFSRITLEEKLGQEYEPYIFAALNSAKAMVVLGTKPEYFNAVWVRNEWSRYLALIRKGEKKVLIPAFRDMDAYSLPEEFSNLQALDMSRLGFMQDLIDGLRKIVGTREKTEQIPQPTALPQTDVGVTLDKALLMIEDGQKKSAIRLLDTAFAVDPKNPLIYLGRLMIERDIDTKEHLADCSQPLEISPNYVKAVRFADAELKAELENMNTAIHERIRERKYAKAVRAFEKATNIKQYREIAPIFHELAGYKDAERYAGECADRAEQMRKDGILIAADKLLRENEKYLELESEHVSQAISLLTPIRDYRNAAEVLAQAEKRQEELQRRIKRKKKAKRLARLITAGAVLLLVAVLVVNGTVIAPKKNYLAAEALFAEGKWAEAEEKYARATGYEDAAEKEMECIYQRGVALRKEKKWNDANACFEILGDYKDSAKLIHKHAWKRSAQKKPTCTAAGSTTYACTCGETKTETVNALGHSWKNATCTQPQKCTRCGKTDGKALGHTSGDICSRCGKTLVQKQNSGTGSSTGSGKSKSNNTVTFQTQNYSGTGSGIVRDFSLPDGKFRVTCTMVSGDCNLTMTLNYGGATNEYGYQKSDELVFNDYNPGSEVTVIEGPVKYGTITVNAGKSYHNIETEWKICIEALG